MKKLISFSVLKRMEIKCANCSYANRGSCTVRNCPVWKKLEPSWTMAVPCRKCVHSSPDDQICEHTGWDKRTLKECPYIMEEK